MPVSTSSSPVPGAGGGASAPRPASAAAPRRGALFVALAGIVALAALGALAVFLIGGRAPATAPPDSAPGTRDADARKEREARKAALDEASREVLMPAVPVPPSSQGGAVPAAGEVVSPSRTDATAATGPASGPGAAMPEGPRPSAGAAATKAAGRAGAQPHQGAKAAIAAPTPAAQAAGIVPPAASAPAPATPVPAPARDAERWAQMTADLSRCSSDSLIPRHQCERRIRARYCDGWWGMVPECPANRSGVRD